MGVALGKGEEKILPFLIPGVIKVARHSVAGAPEKLIVEFKPGKTVQRGGSGLDLRFRAVEIVCRQAIYRFNFEKTFATGDQREGQYERYKIFKFIFHISMDCVLKE